MAAKLSIRMKMALQSAWTDSEGVTRVDNTTKMVTVRALQARGLVQRYSHMLTEAGDLWRQVESAHADAIELDEKRTIARAYGSVPAGVVLLSEEIDGLYSAAMLRRDRDEAVQAGVAFQHEQAANQDAILAQDWAEAIAENTMRNVKAAHEAVDGIVALLNAEALAELVEAAHTEALRMGFAASSNARLRRQDAERRSALYWAGRRFLMLGTIDYQGGRAVSLLEDDGMPLVVAGVDHSFPIRETDLRYGSWTA